MKLIARLLCKLNRHAWTRMHWREAYPASSGDKCTRCGLTKLRWF